MSSNIWQKSVNIDGHQLHQYQHNEQSPLILIELAEHKTTTTYDAGSSGLCFGQVQTFGGINFVNLIGSHSFPLISGSPTTIHIASIDLLNKAVGTHVSFCAFGLWPWQVVLVCLDIVKCIGYLQHFRLPLPINSWPPMYNCNIVESEYGWTFG